MMNRLLRLSLPIFLWLASSPALAQEVAGRVLVAAGDVVIQRGAEKIAARRGAEARTGDIFQVGDKSNVQIRLTDESIIALNSRTTFKLTEYAFQKREPTLRRAFFDLLRGGMRTVTGLIGRTKRENYAVRTPTATVGIRGTHYALRYCNNDCYEGGSASASAEPIKVAAASGAVIGPLAQAASGPGALAPNGTYGAVTDGRIGVTNQTGETVFGSDQYFHVASISSPAQRLIAPPSFLRDTLEGRAAAKGNKPAAGAQPGQQQQSNGEGGESASTVALTGVGGGSGDIGVSGSTTSSTTSSVLAINPFVVTDAAVAGGNIGSIVPVLGGDILVYRITSGLLSGTCSSGPPCDLQVWEIRFAVNPQTQSVAGRINGIDTDTRTGGAVNLSTGLQISFPLVNNNGVLSFSGTLTPSSSGAVLRCQSCGPNDGPDVLQSLTLSGTISGGNLNLTFTGVDSSGDSATFNAVLPQVPLSMTPVAAVVYPRTCEGCSARAVTQSSGYNNVVDSAGLVRYGWFAGGPQGSRGSAMPVIVGSDASAGNLVWGKWIDPPSGAPGAQIVDADYNSFTSTGDRVDWIYGDPTLVTAVSGLGTVTYAPVGWSLNNGNGTLNSASLTANFMTRQIDLNVNASTSAQVGNTFQWTGSTQHGVTNTRFQGGLSGTCTGRCGSGVPSSGSFAGFIAGSAGQGAGVAISGGAGTPGEGVSGVIGFKR